MAHTPQIYRDYEVIFEAGPDRYECKLCDLISLDEAIEFAKRLAKRQGFRVKTVQPITQDLPTVQAR